MDASGAGANSEPEGPLLGAINLSGTRSLRLAANLKAHFLLILLFDWQKCPTGWLAGEREWAFASCVEASKLLEQRLRSLSIGRLSSCAHASLSSRRERENKNKHNQQKTTNWFRWLRAANASTNPLQGASFNSTQSSLMSDGDVLRSSCAPSRSTQFHSKCVSGEAHSSFLCSCPVAPHKTGRWPDLWSVVRRHLVRPLHKLF